MRPSLILRFRPPRIAMVLFLTGFAIHLAIFGLPQTGWPFLPGGAIFFASGFLIMMWAWTLFKEKQTALCPTASATRFVRNGPYRFSRNPMYLGMLIILMSSAIVSKSWILSLAPVLFFLIINGVFIPHEEDRMQEIFGDEYISYQKKVRRWI